MPHCELCSIFEVTKEDAHGELHLLQALEGRRAGERLDDVVAVLEERDEHQRAVEVAVLRHAVQAGVGAAVGRVAGPPARCYVFLPVLLAKC